MVVMVMMVMSVVVVPMMRRVRQRDVCEKNQCDREADNLTHDSIPLILMNGYAPGWKCRPACPLRIAGDALNCAITSAYQRVQLQQPREL
jgi:hypothetical protein